jgi:hypothetical protein
MDEQQRLVARPGQQPALILRNHGLLTVGSTVCEAFVVMHWLERACQAQLMAMACNAKLNMPDPQTVALTYERYKPGQRRNITDAGMAGDAADARSQRPFLQGIGTMLQGKVVVVTGAGGGIGRDFAHAMAAKGAKVVVNDIGSSVSGEARTPARRRKVVDEIKAKGGTAVASTDSVADWSRRTASSRPRSTRSAGSTSSSTTPASCATASSSTCPSRNGRRSSTCT